MKRLLSIVLSICFMLSCFAIPGSVLASCDCEHSKTHQQIEKASFTKHGSIKTICNDCDEELESERIYKISAGLLKDCYTYDGKSKTPKAEVSVETDSDFWQLKSGKDYTIKCGSNTSGVGVHTAKIVVDSKYAKDTKECKYKILPKAKSSVTVQQNGTCSLNVKSNKKCTYKSSDTKVATVNSKGVVTGKKKGKCKITITSNGVSVKTSVEVRGVGIYVDYCNISNAWVHKKGNYDFMNYGNANSTMGCSKTHYDVDNVGAKINLSKAVTTVPSNAKITWKSSNEKIATVNSKGVVTTKKAGEVKITASMTNKGKTYKKTINVLVHCHINGC